jgi:prepilin-type N-terminal cleavage/methylation domain-containing protein
MMHFNKQRKPVAGGFTLIEIIIVVVILGIAAVIAVPMLSSAADMKVRAAANRIAADLEYAKGLAVTHQTGYAVVFNPANESYDIRKYPYGTGNIISNPVRSGSSYVVNFAADSNFERVNIVSADFDSDSDKAVTFDYLGTPYHGLGIASGNVLNSGRITLTVDDFTVYVDVEPMTGYVTITGP